VKRLLAAAAELQAFLVARGWRFCFIGGVAYQRWGRPRVTTDADVTLITGLGSEDEFIGPLLIKYQSRRPDAHAFAVANRVLLLETSDGVDLDIALAAFPYEERVVERASSFDFGDNLVLRTCSAEDLVVLKAIADRRQDWADIEMVIRRQGTVLDREYILANAEPLAEIKEAPEIVDKLRALYDEFPAG
jgi:hypothetical protein